MKCMEMFSFGFWWTDYWLLHINFYTLPGNRHTACMLVSHGNFKNTFKIQYVNESFNFKKNHQEMVQNWKQFVQEFNWQKSKEKCWCLQILGSVGINNHRGFAWIWSEREDCQEPHLMSKKHIRAKLHFTREQQAL